MRIQMIQKQLQSLSGSQMSKNTGSRESEIRQILDPRLELLLRQLCRDSWQESSKVSSPAHNHLVVQRPLSMNFIPNAEHNNACFCNHFNFPKLLRVYVLILFSQPWWATRIVIMKRI